MSKKRILIVEDEQDMAELVAMRLAREYYEIDRAHDGLEALSKIRREPPDLILLDIMLPGMPGTDVLREIRNDPRIADVAVIMLTARGEDGDIVAGLQQGADDYITKPFSLSVLTARIETVLRRKASPAPHEHATLTIGPIRVNQDTHEVEVYGEPVSLTLTEFRLLVALMVARGRVLTRNQLIDHGMGVDAVVTDRTIDVHLAALRRKLGKAKNYIQTVRGLGYRFAGGDDERT